MSSLAEFDQYAASYDELLNTALSSTGETKEYFAENRIRRVAHLLCTRSAADYLNIMDFGCGTGSAIPILRKHFPAANLVGVDNSEESVKIAAAAHGNDRTRFLCVQNAGFETLGKFDLVLTNGVFHHIPPVERQYWLSWIHLRMRSRGVLAFFENNPWNPGTRYVMNRCEFDKDAITLSVRESERRLREAGFHKLTTEHLFFFPASLRSLRFLESGFRRVPLGGQYLCLAGAAF